MAISKKKKAGAKTSKKKTITVDFTGVESGFPRVPDGDYLLEVTKITEEESEESGNSYLSWTYQIVGGKHDGKKVGDILSLSPKALFRLKDLLTAMGAEIPDGEFNLAVEDYIGVQVGATIGQEEYNGKIRSRPAAYFDSADFEESEEGEEEEAEEDEEDGEEESEDEESEEETEEGEDEEEAEEEEEESELEVGSRVSFKFDKKTLKGTVTVIDGDDLSVKVGKDEYELTTDDVTLL